jgi:hypothetical protein
MALNQKYLKRLASRARVSQQSRETPPPKTMSAEQTALKVEAALHQQRIEQRKEGWRASARWLEKNCEEYRQPHNGEVSNAANGTRSSINSPNSEPANETSAVELQPLASAPESMQSAREVLPVPIPLLPASWWQGLLYGSREAMLSPGDANNALRLVARELAKDLNVIEFTDSVRVDTLRKVLDQRFGAGAWPAMNELWRSAPASPGASQPSEDQGQLPPGPSAVGRNQPRWIGELNEPGFTERAWMIENGLWGG